MATVTPQGIVGRDLTSYRTLIEGKFRGRFGDDLSLAPETIEGELAGIMASTATEIDEVVVALSNALSPYRSQGIEIDTLGELLGIRRHGSTRSRVTLTLTGVTGTTVPSGSRAKTSENVEFSTVAAATLPAGGSVQVVAEAVEAGPAQAPAGTIISIVTLVPGWETVTNADAADPGIAREEDLGYRARYLASTARLARGPVDAIQAALIEAAATDFRIEVNHASVDRVVTAFTMPSHSVFVTVKGGQDADIAAAIVKSKGWAATYAGTGARAITVGLIRFRRPEEVAVAIEVSIAVEDDFQADGINEIKRNLVGYADGTWRGGSGQFDTRGFRIGEGIDVRRMQSPINAVPGHQVTALDVTDTSSNALPTTTPTDRLYTLAEANITILIV